MPLLALPNELLLQIAHYLLRCPICHCLHISQHLSALSRSNHHLHFLLGEHVLASASTLHVLLWGILNNRHDTVALALQRGANPNTVLHPNRYSHITGTLCNSTPVAVAIRMRMHSANAETHALKLGTLRLLLAAGGTCTAKSLSTPTRCGDLDLLAICLPHLIGLHGSRQSALQILLEIAARHGHVEGTRLLIHAGADVNYTGDEGGPELYPALWGLWEAPIAILQVLLDAGADATWRSRQDISIVRHIRQCSGGAQSVEDKVQLLLQNGAADEPAMWSAVGWWVRPGNHQEDSEYHGWVPGRRETPVDWTQQWMLAGRDQGCKCMHCQWGM